jgi:hypothetical protein
VRLTFATADEPVSIQYPGGIMTVLRNTAGDPAKQQQAIEALAKESETSVEHVRELYEMEHARLNSQARVKTFVSVIATRLVRNTLHAERTNS